MAAEIICDGVNLTKTYGAIVSQGGYNGLVAWASSKGVHTTSWQESAGVDADLSSLPLSSKTFTLSLGLVGGTKESTNALYDFLAAKPVRRWTFGSIGVSRNLRLVGMSSIEYAISFSCLSLMLGDDSPMSGYTYTAPIVGCVPDDTSVRIDGKMLSDYGVRMVFGTVDSVRNRGSVKSWLLRSSDAVSGSVYDSSHSNAYKDGARSLTLSLNLVAPDLDTMWTNYNALYYDLVKADTGKADKTRMCARVLAIDGGSYNVWYQSQIVSVFWPSDGGRCWIDFSVKLGLLG